MGTRRVLLADDDFDDKMIIKDAVEKVSNAADMIYFADNGEDALSMLQGDIEKDQLPCLIVLDLNMPRLNGTETLRQLKSDTRFNHIPVIIYSTSINPLEKEKCLALGAHSYVTKPVSFNESLETAKIFYRFCADDARASRT